jgi:hypothetical protein
MNFTPQKFHYIFQLLDTSNDIINKKFIQLPYEVYANIDSVNKFFIITLNGGIDTQTIYPRLENGHYFFIEECFKYFKNKYSYIIDFSEESPNIIEYHKDIKYLSQLYNIKQVVLRGNDFNAQNTLNKLDPYSNIRYISDYSLHEHVGIDYQKTNNSVNRKYISTILFRRTSVERLVFTYNLYKKKLLNHNDNIINIFAPNGDFSNRDELFETLSNYNDSCNLSFDIKSLFNQTTVGYDMQNEGGIVDVEQCKLIPKNNDSYFWVSSESTMDNTNIFITEKTLKPFLYQQIPLILMTPNSYRFLQSIGFNLKFKGIDLSFLNKINDTYQNIDNLSSILKEWTDKKEQLPSLFFDNKEILEHNRNLALQFYSDEFAKKQSDYNTWMIKNYNKEKSETEKYKKLLNNLYI